MSIIIQMTVFILNDQVQYKPLMYQMCAKENYSVQKHELYRKDVKWVFGVLQTWFAIIRGAGRFQKKGCMYYYAKYDS